MERANAALEETRSSRTGFMLNYSALPQKKQRAADSFVWEQKGVQKNVMARSSEGCGVGRRSNLQTANGDDYVYCLPFVVWRLLLPRYPQGLYTRPRSDGEEDPFAHCR